MGKTTDATKESARHASQSSPFFKSEDSRGTFFQTDVTTESPAAHTVQRKCTACEAEERILPQLEVGPVDDPLEIEADAMAERVVRRQADMNIGEREAGPIQTRSKDTASSESAPASVDRVIGTAGRPLDGHLRNEMEQHFHSDFSQVQVHTDASAEQSARDLKARAYTVGNHIVFGAGRFAPQTPAGRRLLAHELTHVVQQSGASARTVQREPDGATDINGKYDVEWKINEGTAQVSYGKKSLTIPLGSRENSEKLVRALGIDKKQASAVLRDIHANVPHQKRLLISFVQNVGNPRDYAIRRFREMREGGLWPSDALARPPVEGIRQQVRVPGANRTALELSEYGYVFFETNNQTFVPKPSGTARGIQEYQHLNAAKNRTPALTAPVAIVRVDDKGKIVEIVEHALSGSPEEVKGKLVREFQNAGWKADFSAPPPAADGAPPPPRAPIDAHKPPDMGKKPSPMDAHKPPDMGGKKPSPMDAHQPPDMGKKPSPMDAHKPPDMTPGAGGGGATTVSRFRAAGRFLAREAPGLALQAVFMLIFPPQVIFRQEKLAELSAKKINPAAMDALAKQQAVFDKLLAEDPAKAIYANFTVRLDYSVSASHHADLLLDLKDMALVDVKITRHDITTDSKFTETGRLTSSKQITTSMLLYESVYAAQLREFNEDLRRYRECLQTPGVGQGAGADPYSHCIPPRLKPIK